MLQTTSYQVLNYVNCASSNPSLWLLSPFCTAHPQGWRHCTVLAGLGAREGDAQQEKQGHKAWHLCKKAAIPLPAHPTGSAQGSVQGEQVLGLSSDTASLEGAELTPSKQCPRTKNT